MLLSAWASRSLWMPAVLAASALLVCRAGFGQPGATPASWTQESPPFHPDPVLLPDDQPASTAAWEPPAQDCLWLAAPA